MLCQLVNKIAPGSIKKVNKGSLAFHQMENISHFIRVAKNMGCKDIFDTVDLYNGRDIGKVVTGMHAFGSAVQANVKSYNGPQFGVKIAKANKREFTEEQLKASRAATSKINQGSAEHMQRTHIYKTGITFGNEAGGSGDTSILPRNMEGSSGVMERTGVIKTGITFGNDAGGSGDTRTIPRSMEGSAGVMERPEIKKSGITFGNDAGGAGDTSTIPRNMEGSAGVMERTGVIKTGITFGNEAAGGSGDTSTIPRSMEGSAGVMERPEVKKTGITFGNDATKA